MQFPEIELGIAPGIGALAVPYRRWPAAAEFHCMLLRAEKMSAAYIEAALEIGYEAFGRSGCTAAAREGIAALGEGRAPDIERTG